MQKKGHVGNRTGACSSICNLSTVAAALAGTLEDGGRVSHPPNTCPLFKKKKPAIALYLAEGISRKNTMNSIRGHLKSWAGAWQARGALLKSLLKAMEHYK